ncbi:hypothetical protein K6119_03970 [Paracrocinitomix mangrovi]|uniref:hypothetical protein n=1 Tax=Paracrocinitomix mangrovi TaxID=2862509 RepID=UPI001C8E602D|nr:hypothetical protein [Paracrocinitomix mangrovi]UKN02669.1 hypothetical protein K6119_03970 [Paracrocinitomix mangrovi]
MAKYIKHTWLLVFLFAFNQLNAQTKVFEPKGSLSIDVGIPAQGKNESFGRVMNGLFNGGINYQYNVYKGLTIGLGAKYSYFIVNSFALNNVNWRGGLHMPALYGKIGYEKFISERFSVNASTRLGYAMMISANDSCQKIMGKPHTEGTFFIEPQVELLFTTDKNSASGFSLVLGYNFYMAEFGPEYLCMDEIPNLFEEDYVGITRFLSIGFGYRHYMGRK